MHRSATPALLLSALLSSSLLSHDLPAQSGSASTTDPKAGHPDLEVSDAIAFKTWAEKGKLWFEVELATALDQGMFTCLHVYLDADQKPDTGRDGAEIWLRASVGSRFHPNSFVPPKSSGSKAAIALRRASFSYLRQDDSAGREGRNWLHDQALATPEVEGTRLRFFVPTELLARHGDRYGSAANVRAELETSCTDQPLMLRHQCNDEGVSIAVDGEARDWSHPGIAKDPGGELHKVARFLDLRSLQAEHDLKSVYAKATLELPGLAADDLPQGEIERFDGVTFYFEPLFPRYQGPARLFVRYGATEHPARHVRGGRFHGVRSRGGGEWKGAVKGDTVEVRMQRKSGQNDFRVYAWSDLRRLDVIPNEGWLSIDWGQAR